ncbi:hypothetical protein PAECIP112173_03182 [Paenibacillus sp. JJ-100]|nr:hypothetical protein PAECIP112173_03182 [Paenibacillus sp. JJ-100]
MLPEVNLPRASILKGMGLFCALEAAVLSYSNQKTCM